jgi:hypothetical protein
MHLAGDVAAIYVGDRVQINATFSDSTAVPDAHEIRGFSGSRVVDQGPDPDAAKLRQDVIEWLRNNNSFPARTDGTDNDLVKNMSARAESAAEDGDDIQITFGPKLMKSKKATVLSLQDGKMLPVEYTAEQTAALDMPLSTAEVNVAQSHAIRVPVEAEISVPNFPETTWHVGN